jgi:hypothetical protein
MAIEFEACIVMPCGDLDNQHYIQARVKTTYMCTGPTPFYLKGSYEGGDTPCYHGKQQDG